MKVLWISNGMFPEACRELHIDEPALGGWMYSGAMALLETNPAIELAVAALYSGKEFKCIDKYKIKYYLIPSKGGNKKYNALLEPYLKRIKSEFNPEIVHIHGSEYPHSLAWVRACGNENVVVSIQGLVSVYARYFLGGIPLKDIKKSITIRDIIRNDSLLSQQKSMCQRGDYEIELLKNVRHIIGRTTWDRSNSWAINPLANYHFCNETLRTKFYNSIWQYNNCEKHTIFLSQAHYPIKGIQQIVKAMPFVLKHYPNTIVYVSGLNFINSSFIRRNGFASYLIKLMKKHGVVENFRFLGILNEEEMVNQFLKANVFVCPSSIENSPNSVGEAQLLGTPCIASYVGGSMDMIQDGESGFLYRFEEVKLLAMRICQIFEDGSHSEQISKKERLISADRHNKVKNGNRLNEIYKTILSENISSL
jgi:glycosyltransferase involved in cell wall biosynthesis